MRESDIEKHLVREVERRGGLAFKFVSPGVVGVPDRLVKLPGSPAFFVELKARAGCLSPLQVRRQSDIEAAGMHCHTVFSVEEVNTILDLECIAPAR